MGFLRIITSIIFLNLAPLLVGATSHGRNPIVLQNPLRGGNSLSGFISTLLKDVVVPVGAVVVVIAIIYAGFLFVTAQGNETKLGKAKLVFLYTVIGAAVLLGASVLADVIRATINQLR